MSRRPISAAGFTRSLAPALRPAQGNSAPEAAASAEEILHRIYALPEADQLRTVEFLRGHSSPGLRACAEPLEDALAQCRLIGGTQ